jgi:hypothetical protein
MKLRREERGRKDLPRQRTENAELNGSDSKTRRADDGQSEVPSVPQYVTIVVVKAIVVC